MMIQTHHFIRSEGCGLIPIILCGSISRHNCEIVAIQLIAVLSIRNSLGVHVDNTGKGYY
jgi:hypothetical protein